MNDEISGRVRSPCTLELPAPPPDPVLPKPPSLIWFFLKGSFFVTLGMLAAPWLFFLTAQYLGWVNDTVQGTRRPVITYMVTESPETGERAVHWIEIDGKRYNPPGVRLIRPWN